MADDFNPTSGWFTDAPGGDQTFDQLFPDPNGDGQPPAPPAATPPQSPEQFFLRTATGTVYKTASDAVSGIEHKDNLIRSTREDVIAKFGYDPVTKQQVRKVEPPKVEPPRTDPSEPVYYSRDPKKYWDDQVAAANRGDYEAYMRVQAQLMNEQFAPYAPIVANFAKFNAIEQVASAYPEFKSFYNSEQYQRTLNAIPLLKQAIEAAESNPQMAAQLDNLYKTAYLTGQGLRLAEAPPAPTRVDVPQGTQPPTLTSGQLPPPTPTQAPQFDPNTREGRSQARQQVIKDLEARGVGDFKF